MTNTQHTPGPWEITGHGSRPTPCTWVSLGDEDDGNSLEVVGDNHGANARLIAEAPAMLDALRVTFQFIEDHALDAFNEVVGETMNAAGNPADRIRAILAKIDGGAE